MLVGFRNSQRVGLLVSILCGASVGTSLVSGRRFVSSLAKIGFVLASCLIVAACAVGGDAKSVFGDAEGGDAETIAPVKVDVNDRKE